MIKYILLLCIVTLSLHNLSHASTGYQLSDQDVTIVSNFVSQVQALSASKPSEVSAKISDLMSRARLTPRPYHVLSLIQDQLQDGMQTQTINNPQLNISITLPKTWTIDDDDTDYGLVAYAPTHDQVAGVKSISIYQINAKTQDTNLDQHITTTIQHQQTDYSGYNHTGTYQTTIKSIPAKGYQRSATEYHTQTPIQGAQIVSLDKSKGITMTYTTTHNTYTSFVSIFENLKTQIK